MSKRISVVALQALKEALCTIYWYKNDLRSFLQNCITDTNIITSANWENYKRQIISDIIDSLAADQERHIGDIRRLFHEVCQMKSFSHLEHLEDGQQKVARAKKAVRELCVIVEKHDRYIQETKNTEERREQEYKRSQEKKAVNVRVEEIKDSYYNLLSSLQPQKRGFALERILFDLFELFDLDPKASFKNIGEQIDGAFSLEGFDYLFEAKWQRELTAIQDLDAFGAKVKRKLDNTLGLFLSINGFSPDAVRAHSTGRPVLILMTGADLMAVLDQRIDFVSLIQRKRRHAAQTGKILFEINDMFS